MPELEYAYYGWALLLIVGACIAWVLNFFAMPGNWMIVGLAALLAWINPAQATGTGMEWSAVGIILLLAVGGEVLEAVSGAYGAGKRGASRRAMILAVVGTVAGSIIGAIGALPILVVGPILGALVGGALGAFAGAYVGEMWKHGFSDKSISVGWGALIGRLLGTLGKLVVGAIMVVALAVQALS